MIREVAGHDADRMKAMLHWPIREAVLAYLSKMKQASLDQYRANLQVWASRTAFGGKVKPPEVPRILR